MMRSRFVAITERSETTTMRAQAAGVPVFALTMGAAHPVNLAAVSWPLTLSGFGSLGAALRVRRARATVLT
jgi:hypothetical protein